MDIKSFWDIVAAINWGDNHKTLDIDCVKYRLAFQLGKEESQSMDRIFQKLQGKLYKVLDKWEKDNDKDFGIGDDSFGDLIAHIIGMGEAEYEACMADPARAYQRALKYDFGESFAYCIPSVSTFKDMEYLPVWRKDIIDNVTEIINNFPVLASLCSEILFSIDALDSMEAKTREGIKVWRERMEKQAEAIYSQCVGTPAHLEKLKVAVDYIGGGHYTNYITDMISFRAAEFAVGKS